MQYFRNNAPWYASLTLYSHTAGETFVRSGSSPSEGSVRCARFFPPKACIVLLPQNSHSSGPSL